MKHYSTREAARILETTEAQVRTYARLGQIDAQRGPGRRLEFSFQELLLLKTTKGLLDSGVPARSMRRIWSSLRRQLTGEMPLTGVTIFADGQRAVAVDGNARWQPDSGQFLLDLESGDIAARTALAELPSPTSPTEPEAEDLSTGASAAPVAKRDRRPPLVLFPGVAAGHDRFTETRRGAEPGDRAPRAPHERGPGAEDDPRSPALTAEQWFQTGCELEDASALESRQAYHQAIEIDPDFADAHVNLGRHYHEAGELGKAEAHYRDAVRVAAENPVAHFNLGVLLEDRARPSEAIHAYQRAIALDPELADAHYNLGLLLETLGRRSAAMRHLMSARHLYERTTRGG